MSKHAHQPQHQPYPPQQYGAQQYGEQQHYAEQHYAERPYGGQQYSGPQYSEPQHHEPQYGYHPGEHGEQPYDEPPYGAEHHRAEQHPPQQYQPQQPPPPRKKRTGLKTTLGLLAALVVVGGIASVRGGQEGTTEAKPDKKAAAPAEDAEPESGAKGGAKADSAAEDGKQSAKSQTEQFKTHIEETGTAQQKEAAKHVTSVTGADKRNDIMDSAEIHTDYTGGLTGPHNGDGKLLASAFATWKHSKNGLVTVYDAEGQVLSNGNY
ncbi:hypothetical protein [Streptomyces sp. enrichment culture]|uniref:hypothetical protein n=1 Tax=Streptomyces sp. enrichment culture TaxID=1795815 RepID=UPI003F56A31E